MKKEKNLPLLVLVINNPVWCTGCSGYSVKSTFCLQQLFIQFFFSWFFEHETVPIDLFTLVFVFDYFFVLFHFLRVFNTLFFASLSLLLWFFFLQLLKLYFAKLKLLVFLHSIISVCIMKNVYISLMFIVLIWTLFFV